MSWDQLMSSIVFKNETNVELGGIKTFTAPIEVRKLIETEKLNNISLENILTLGGVQELKGPLIFHGDVEVNDLKLHQDLNEVQISEIMDNLKFNNGTYILKGMLNVIYNIPLEG